MSVKRHVKMTICCDGPCGTTVSGETPQVPKVPRGWEYLSFGAAAPANGEANFRQRALLCPHCLAEAEALLKHAGFSFSPVRAEEPAVPR